ncbi:MAG TPA: zinc ribbon domain-containing protein [bacterium]|nr:zinc ribbon domain-containing protein [bacterium]
MPTYEFLCESCANRFELFLPITAGDPESCPECGRGPIRRLPSPGAGLIFRGSGFYATDYRPESYKKAERRERDTETDGKPAEKSPAKTDGKKPDPEE